MSGIDDPNCAKTIQDWMAFSYHVTKRAIMPRPMVMSSMLVGYG